MKKSTRYWLRRIREGIPIYSTLQVRRLVQKQKEECNRQVERSLARQRDEYIIELRERMDPLIEDFVKTSVQSEIVEHAFTCSIRVDRHMLEMMHLSSDSGRQAIRDYVVDRLYYDLLKAYHRENRIREAF